MSITSTAELLQLRDRCMLPKSYLSEKRHLLPNDAVVTNNLLYTRSMQAPNTIITSDSSNVNTTLSMNAAIKSLR